MTFISIVAGFYFVIFLLSLCGLAHFRIGVRTPPALEFHLCHGCSNFTLLFIVVECSWLHPPEDPQ